MPSRNIIKQYVENGVYHIYNRGVEKRIIFQDQKDYAVFMHLLKEYLLPKEDTQERSVLVQGRTLIRIRRSFYGKIELFAFCLMPNHFHLLIKQKGQKDISEFMKCLATSYSIYFNTKYDRVGSLFQGRYKAVLVNDDSYFLHLSRYIHLNPLEGLISINISNYDFSSYQNYLGIRNTKWLNTKQILDYFDTNKSIETIKSQSYKEFVEKYALDSKEILSGLTID